MVLCFSQTKACSFSRHLLRPTGQQVPRCPHRWGQFSNHFSLPSLRPRHCPAEPLQGLQLHVTSLILTEVQPWWHSNATIFKCHEWSQIIEETVIHSCLSEKSTSKHVRWFFQPDRNSNPGPSSNPLKSSVHCVKRPVHAFVVISVFAFRLTCRRYFDWLLRPCSCTVWNYWSVLMQLAISVCVTDTS